MLIVLVVKDLSFPLVVVMIFSFPPLPPLSLSLSLPLSLSLIVSLAFFLVSGFPFSFPFLCLSVDLAQSPGQPVSLLPPERSLCLCFCLCTRSFEIVWPFCFSQCFCFLRSLWFSSLSLCLRACLHVCLSTDCLSSFVSFF